MNMNQDLDVDEAAFRLTKTTIDQNYPAGQFVAFHHGQIVADCASFSGLVAVLEERGISPSESLVVQAGVEYPEATVIFLEGDCQ